MLAIFIFLDMANLLLNNIMLKRVTLISMKLQNTIRKYPIQHQSLKMHFSEREREREREREGERGRERER